MPISQFDLYEHQKRGVEFIAKRAGVAGLLCEMGT